MGAGLSVSSGLVGLIGIAGKRGGAPGMALSRAVFGQRGNLLPGSLIWIARWGWETINAVTGAYALLFVITTFAISGLGIGAVQKCTRWATCFFGAFSVLVLGHLVVETD